MLPQTATIRSKVVLQYGLYKIFVCWFRDCALINAIVGTRHHLYGPPLFVAINIGQSQSTVSSQASCFGHFQHIILVYLYWQYRGKVLLRVLSRLRLAPQLSHRGGETTGNYSEIHRPPIAEEAKTTRRIYRGVKEIWFWAPFPPWGVHKCGVMVRFTYG